MVGKDAADRLRDFGRGEAGGRHLIQQRLEQVMILPIDEGDVRARVAEGLTEGQPSEPGTQHHDMRSFSFHPALSIQLPATSVKRFATFVQRTTYATLCWGRMGLSRRSLIRFQRRGAFVFADGDGLARFRASSPFACKTPNSGCLSSPTSGRCSLSYVCWRRWFPANASGSSTPSPLPRPAAFSSG